MNAVAGAVLQLMVYVNGQPFLTVEIDFPTVSQCESAKHLTAAQAGQMIGLLYPGPSIVIRGRCHPAVPDGSEA